MQFSPSQPCTQSITQVSLSSNTGFPAAWLTPDDEKYVIDRTLWNTEAAPEHKRLTGHFSVMWGRFAGRHLMNPDDAPGSQIVGIIARFYYGIEGCIIPVGCIPQLSEIVFAFTLAGPCDGEGKKEFYLMVNWTDVRAGSLRRYTPGFSSVADFHLNHSTIAPAGILPLPGGEQAVYAQYRKFDIRYYDPNTVTELTEGDLEWYT